MELVVTFSYEGNIDYSHGWSWAMGQEEKDKREIGEGLRE